MFVPRSTDLPDLNLVLALDLNAPIIPRLIVEAAIVATVVSERAGLVSPLRLHDVLLATNRSVVGNSLVVFPQARSLVVRAGTAEGDESGGGMAVRGRSLVAAGEEGLDRGRVSADDTDNLQVKMLEKRSLVNTMWGDLTVSRIDQFNPKSSLSGVCRQMMQRRRVQMTMKKPAQNIKPKDSFLVYSVSACSEGLTTIN